MSFSHNSALFRVWGRSLTLPSRSDLDVCFRLLLCVAAILLDYLISPALYNGSTLWASAALLLLIFRRGQAAIPTSAEFTPTKFSMARLTLFLALHAVVIAIGRNAGSLLASAAASDGFTAALLAAAKLLILLPVIVLFSRTDWRVLLRKYRFEVLAAAVVLCTFFPYRLFHTVWPQYSQVIASLAYHGAKPFVADLALVKLPIPTIFGPKIALEIVFWCSGYSALALFDTLIALIAVLDWNELNPRRLLVVYICGAMAVLLANVVRIWALIMAGNLIAPQYAMGRFHVNAGWVFFAAIYLAILSVSYRWMLSDHASSKPNKSGPMSGTG